MHNKLSNWLIVLGATLGCSIFAQQRADIEVTRASIQAKRTVIIKQAIDLTDEEEPAFWSLYRQYRAEMATTEDFETKLLLALDDAGYILADQEAARLLNESVKLDRMRLGIVRKYIKKFRSILPASKVARFFHLEAKMDAIVDYEIATQVPLVE